MSLYTKHRPHSFADVHGQETSIAYLRSIVEKVNQDKDVIDDIPHAYLFCGGHGIGKTTLARIFARELGTTPDDTYELDAASTSRKIDDMRTLIESVYTLPIFSKYKVYILDEAHALTKDSSNAFLKTLEEPPKHVIFILCTTDPDKLLATIRSRCNIVEFRLPTVGELVERLHTICERENLTVNKDILGIIASHSNRSYRDALTILEKVLYTYGEGATTEDLEMMFGATREEVYLNLIEHLDKKEIEPLLSFLQANYKKLHYSTFLDYLRVGILIRQKNPLSEDSQSLNSGSFSDLVARHSNFFSSVNLLFFLERVSLVRTSHDMLSAYIAVFGSFVEGA